MNWRIVWALILKDLNLFFRNRFFAFVTILGLVAYIGIYYLLPGSVDETIKVGLVAKEVPPVFEELQEEGLELELLASEAELEQRLLDGELTVGYGLPDDFISDLLSGNQQQIKVYFNYDFPDELKDAYIIVFRELVFMMSGQDLNVQFEEVVFGQDMAGAQIPARVRMVPLMAVFVLMIETMGLSSLISAEVEEGTLTALFTTPMGARELFAGKGIAGAGMAFAQVVVLMTFTGGLKREPLLVLIALILGSLLVTGIGFLMASGSRDMMSVMGWGILAVIVLSLPSFSVLFPGVFTNWIKAIPSFYLVDTVHQVINFGAGWSEVGINLLMLLGLSLAFLGLGVLTLQRRYR